MNQIVIISESETDIHVHMDGDNIDILKGMEESKSTKIPDMKFYLQLPF